MNISVSAKRVFQILFGIGAVLLLLHVLTQWLFYQSQPNDFLTQIVARFDVGTEINIPTWFSQLLLLIGSVLIACIGAAKRQHGDRYTAHWIWLAIIFLYLSIDETAVLHEIGDFLHLQEVLGLNSGYFIFGWVLVAAVTVPLFLFLFHKFWKHLPPPTRVLFALAGGIYLFGALGTEVISANYRDQHGFANFAYRGTLAVIEEGLEMLGVVIFIYALVDYIRKMQLSINLHFRK